VNFINLEGFELFESMYTDLQLMC